LLVSLPREKEFEKIVRHLAGAGADRTIFTRYPSDLAVPPEELAGIWRSCALAAAEIVTDPEAAFHRAVQGAGPQGLVVVTGCRELGGYCRPLAHTCATQAVA